MIEVTRFNDTTFLLNSDLIETIEETPDTVITLSNGRKYIVKESGKIIMDRVVDFKNRIFKGIISN